MPYRTQTITICCVYNIEYIHLIVFDLCSRGSETTINTQSSLPLLAKGKDQLTEYHVGGMYTERLTSEEPYSGLVTVIMMEHLYATQVSSTEAISWCYGRVFHCKVSTYA